MQSKFLSPGTTFCYIVDMEVISGKIVTGLGLGKKLGFPTINLPYFGKESGVFAGEVFLNGVGHPAAINIGSRPTVDDKKNLCEAFLLNISASDEAIINEIKPDTAIQIHLKQKIRDTKKFANLVELKTQIAKDVEFVKTCYNL